MPKKLSKEQFIERAMRVHGDKYDYSDIEYSGYRGYVTIRCLKHGLFKQRVSKHLLGQGCPKCSREAYVPMNKLTQEDFIDRSYEKFGCKYDYSDCVYTSMRSKVTLRCIKHDYKFEQIAYQHLQGKLLCPKCLFEEKNYMVKGYWTYENAKNIALGYTSVGEFKKNNYRCYSSCVRLGYLKRFTWLSRVYDSNENLISMKNYIIYAYEFPDFNCVYVGLTLNPKERYIKHRSCGTVYKFCMDRNIDLPMFKIVEDGLDISSVGDREIYWMGEYERKGFKLLNKKRGGSLGSLHNRNK